MNLSELKVRIGDSKIALYGLGTETERFLDEHRDKLNVIGLLDSFRTDGEMYGYPIIPIETLPENNVRFIIVIARPGSCKAIAKRIGDFCRENDIALFDIRGKDLLDISPVTYNFKNVNGSTRKELLNKIENADVISFDLFDTLVMRKTSVYTDVFDILDNRLQEKGIDIPEFSRKRLFSEKELSKKQAPLLEEIYDFLLIDAGVSSIKARELSDMEWNLDATLMIERTAVTEIFRDCISKGKKVVITTDNYYSKGQVAGILERFGLTGYDELLVSCEYHTSKTQNLYEILKGKYKGLRILHVGDDEYADIEKAVEHGIDTYRLFSAAGLFDALGGLDVEPEIRGISDHIKLGLFIARIFNNPFCFEDEAQRVAINDASDIGYLFCAPMITDFVLWMKASTEEQEYSQILFGARDGYLIEKLYKKLESTGKYYYFLTSRTAAIRAGIDTQEDIDYVDSMKYSGTTQEALRARFGIEVEDVNAIDCNSLILNNSKKQRENYHKYIKKLGVGEENLAFFDFVAKGTTQMYLQKLFSQHLKGFYFLQLEPEFMKDKGLDIEPFYSDEEKNTSAIFENYYILETMLTAPYPQMVEMDDDGNPVFAKETRSEQNLQVFERTQQGIIEFFEDYLRILPDSSRTVNKKLDEKLLALVNKVQILDKEFLSLKVEDPFFGRMTDIKDILG